LALDKTGAGAEHLLGIVESTYNGYRIGGEVANQSVESLGYILYSRLDEPGYTPVASYLSYLYILMPFGLPRWCKYTGSSGGTRHPGPFCGILALSTKACGASGSPLSAVSIPAWFKLGGSSTGRCVAIQPVNVGGDHMMWVLQGDWLTASAAFSFLAPTSGGGTASVTYTLVQDIVLPRICTAVKGQFVTDIGVAIGPTEKGAFAVTTKGLTDSQSVTADAETVVVMDGYYYWNAEFPIVPAVPFGVSAVARTVVHSIALGGATTYANQSLDLYSWKLNY
jgi:hypothetical protein